MKHESSTLARALSLRHVVLFGLAFMAPLTVFVTYGVAIESTRGMIPTAYAIALTVMLFTAYSYGAMSKAFPIAGSSYTFTQKAISSHLGFLVGWTILLDYVLSPMISSLIVGLYANAYFPSIPMFVWIILFITVITTVNILGIKIAASFNMCVVVFQILFFAAFTFLSIKGLLAGQGAGHVFSLLPFYDPHVELASLFGVIPLLCFSFLGFDAVSTLSEETRNPVSTLPRAILLITLIGGILFIVVTYFAQLIFPQFREFASPETAATQIIVFLGGNALNAVFTAVMVTTSFASAVASGASSSRILYAMGREKVLPQKVFGYLSPRFQTPVYNLLLIGAISLSAIYMDIDKAVSFINFGALFAFIFVNLSVIAHYFIKKRNRSAGGWVRYFFIPLVGALCTGWFWTQSNAHALLFGGSWLFCGIVYLMYVTKMFRKKPPELHFDEGESA
ncbi:APC family permease [Brevibacillus fluminis]|uniref:APC family permease n=1 Tax=Brevibacillus fluminis TaxID=511487 RepID=A0A3M8DVZ5_9BACL|nr:APC family permease [Brevibacillus fluminis]RNB92353.1 APC family permease [Brevibacillus fluminis]